MNKLFEITQETIDILVWSMLTRPLNWGKEILLPADQYNSIFMHEGKQIKSGYFWSPKISEEPIDVPAYLFRKPVEEKHKECYIPELHGYHCIIVPPNEAKEEFSYRFKDEVPHFFGFSEGDYAIAKIPKDVLLSAALVAEMKNRPYPEQIMAYRELIKQITKDHKFRNIGEGKLHFHEYPSPDTL